MSRTVGERLTPEREILALQDSIDQSNLRLASQLSMAEKLKIGADLYDNGIQWLKQIIKAELPDLGDEQVDQELDRRRAIQRKSDEAGLIRPYMEDRLSGEV